MLVAIGALTLLAGCSAAETADPTKLKTAAPSPQSVEDEQPAAWSAPEACAALELTPGTTIDGEGLGACLSTALFSFGSGRESLDSSTGTGEVVFRYVPDFEFQGTLVTAEGDVHMTYADSTMWIDRGTGVIKGDLNSEDFEEQVAGLTGEMYRMFSDPALAAEMIGSSPVWAISEIEPFTLGNGEVSQSYRITSSAAFTWNEIPISQYSVWFESDWTPTGSEATIEMMGISDTARQTYYELGEPVEITPVG